MSGPPAHPGPPPGPPSLPPSVNSKAEEPRSPPLAASQRPPQPEQDSVELDRLLARERTSLFQQLEIDRILSSFKLNPYDVLQVPLEADDKEINKIYRKKSLLIHPDKVKHERAIEAFDLLKKASSHLLDEGKRKALDETVMDARLMVLKQLELPFSTPAEDARLQGLVPSWEERVRKATKELMVDDELCRRKAIRLQHQAEGEAQRKKEEAIAERKRKADEQAEWEATRDTRVQGWRTFAKGAKKKKKESNILG